MDIVINLLYQRLVCNGMRCKLPARQTVMTRPNIVWRKQVLGHQIKSSGSSGPPSLNICEKSYGMQ